MLLIVDIDGTIADWRKRAAYAGAEPDRSDKAAFDAWLNRLQSKESLLADEPIINTRYLVQQMSLSCEVIYLTGRSEMHRDATSRWLFENSLPAGQLIMRGNTDYRTAGDYKEDHIKELSKEWKSILVLDDDIDGDCSERYRRYGAVHLKVLV